MSPTWTYTPAEKIEGKDTVNPGTSMMSSLVYVWDHVTPRSGTSMEAVTVTGSSHLLTCWEIMLIFSYDRHNVISWKELVVLVIVIRVGLPALIRLQKQKIKHFPESLGWKKTTSSNLLRLIWKKKKNACSAGYTFSLNVIGSSTKFILHVIVLQSSLIEQPSLSWVWDIPEHEPPEYSAI